MHAEADRIAGKSGMRAIARFRARELAALHPLAVAATG
jgi:hypothetical protein